MSRANPVRRLSAEVARKIAAGEVIDRPSAIVRELMDNAIDSGADKITVEIAGGGIDKVRIVDNGCGMTREDLAECAHPHSTSKISEETDLLNLTTLGFRGEALASIAAVCRLSITSGGHKMRASITEDHIIEQAAPLEGTIVQAEGLFENFPARRRFLKRPATETAQCRNTFIEKCLPFPQKSFRFISDGGVRLDLPAGQTLSERFVRAMEFREDASLFYELGGRAPGGSPAWSFKIVIGEPGVFRSNKKDILIFANGRRIMEFSLVQAVEYGGQGYFPNGTFPVAAVFATVDPAAIDFNIHPSKREARFQDIAPLHHGISSAVRGFFNGYTRKTVHDALAVQTQLFGSDIPPAAPSAERQAAAKSRSAFFGSPASGAAAGHAAEAPSASLWRQSVFPKSAPESIRSAAAFQPSYKIEHTPEQDGVLAERTAEKEAAADTAQAVAALADQALAAYHRADGGKMQVPPHAAARSMEGSGAPERTEAGAGRADGEAAPVRGGSAPSVQDAFRVFQKNQAQGVRPAADGEFHFVGSALGTFIIAEKGGTLYIIDKHAAHERILYNAIIEGQGRRQALLVPYVVETAGAEDDAYLARIQPELEEIGFSCRNAGNGRWEFTTLQERWSGSEEDLARALLDSRVQPGELIYAIAATAACKAAVKDGWILDDGAAAEIARQALLLPDPHCPHGRPVYAAVTREQLFSLVRRT